MVKELLLISIICLCWSAKAQVNIIKDNRIDQKVKQKGGKTLSGYRIQIAFDSNKDVIDETRKKFNRMYPKTDTYMNFEAPNFNLKVGDFRTMNEAEKFRQKIMNDFPMAIIHKENINLPRLEQEDN